MAKSGHPSSGRDGAAARSQSPNSTSHVRRLAARYEEAGNAVVSLPLRSTTRAASNTRLGKDNESHVPVTIDEKRQAIDGIRTTARRGDTIRAPLGGMNWEPLSCTSGERMQQQTQFARQLPDSHNIARPGSVFDDPRRGAFASSKQSRGLEMAKDASTAVVGRSPFVQAENELSSQTQQPQRKDRQEPKKVSQPHAGDAAHSRNRPIDGLPLSVEPVPQSLYENRNPTPRDLLATKPTPATAKDHSETKECVASGAVTGSIASPIDKSGGATAFPASKVFAPDALPLHLPDLDDLLQNDTKLRPPIFSRPSTLCSEEEAHLFGYGYRDSASASRLEVAGSQLAVPAESSESDIRRRSLAKQSATSHADNLEAGQCLDEFSLGKTSILPLTDSATSTEDAKQETSDATFSSATLSMGVASKYSSYSHPVTRTEMFPPLMLLKQNSLDELKSNAVGPRKPPGGFLGALPGIGSIIGTIIDFIIGVEGSSLAAGIFRLQLFIDFVQLMNLNLHYTSWVSTGPTMLERIHSVIALDFVTAFGAAIAVLYVLTGVVALLMLAFWRITKKYNPNRTLEGYASQPWLFRFASRSPAQPGSASSTRALQKSTVWSKTGNVLLVMILTILYIPLSKLAMDALVWNINYWPDKDRLKPLTSKRLTQVTTQFCYSTSTEASSFNWAYVILPVSALTLIGYTLWFPYLMSRTIKQLLPRVDPNDEFGRPRSKQALDYEYMRILGRDSSPLNFMYNAYRRDWGNYKPMYILCFKLSTLLIISVFTQQNCLWQHRSTREMLVIQQSVLIGIQSLLLGIHLAIKPFVDQISNRSELVSRSSYTVTSIIGLLVALQVQGSTVYQSVILYIVQAITYVFNIYFTLIGTSWAGHLIKRLQRRFDFSVDVFSPVIDLERHVKRRVWQETLSTILLVGQEYRMPLAQTVTFAIDDNWPPYLLQFRGSIAERHVENLKIFKSIGVNDYKCNIARLYAGDDSSQQWRKVIKRIQLQFTGPDAYWQPLDGGAHSSVKALQGVSSYFGKAFLVPFPPTLVMIYDQAAHGLSAPFSVQLTTLRELEDYVEQNTTLVVQSRRWVRQSLRALDGQRVRCPYVRTVEHSADSLFSSIARKIARTDRYSSLSKSLFYEEGILSVGQKAAPQPLEEYNFSGGFDVSVTYHRGRRQDPEGLTIVNDSCTVDGATAFGLRYDYEFSPSVQHFLAENDDTIRQRLPQVQDRLREYRMRFYEEAKQKRQQLSYSFLTEIFDAPTSSLNNLEQHFQADCSNTRVRELPQRYPATLTLLLERHQHVHRTRIHMWWYLFWDDLWRQNSQDYSTMRQHRLFFNPMFPSSVAYTPMPRAQLEAALRSKDGVWPAKSHSDKAQRRAKRDGIFNDGLINRIYFTLDEITFAKSPSMFCESVPQATDSPSPPRHGSALHLGIRARNGTVVPYALYNVDSSACQGKHSSCSIKDRQPMSRLTGGGTNEDDLTITERHAWYWTEQWLTDRRVHTRWQRYYQLMLEWLSIHPHKLDNDVAPLFIYLRLVNGRYEAASPPPSRSITPRTQHFDGTSSARPDN